MFYLWQDCKLSKDSAHGIFIFAFLTATTKTGTLQKTKQNFVSSWTEFNLTSLN